MEDGKLDLVIGTGPGARTVELRLPPFTLVGATTRAGLLSQPFTARFGITHRLDFYDAEALATIVTRSADILGCPIEPAGAREIARRSRGTPRIANRLLRRVRDYAEVAGESAITERAAEVALDKLEVDQYGLDEIDRTHPHARSSSASAAGPSASRRSRTRSARTRARSRTCTSRSSCSRASCSGRRRGAWPPRSRIATSGSKAMASGPGTLFG